MSGVEGADRKANATDTELVVSLTAKPLVRQEEQVQEAIWQLQDEVRRLHEELARTRRALEQQAILLCNTRQPE